MAVRKPSSPGRRELVVQIPRVGVSSFGAYPGLLCLPSPLQGSSRKTAGFGETLTVLLESPNPFSSCVTVSIERVCVAKKVSFVKMRRKISWTCY